MLALDRGVLETRYLSHHPQSDTSSASSSAQNVSNSW